jgi:DNA-binding transcriptional LysR family regulator
MNPPDPSPARIESRPLRYFVAVAEELNFGRAAERLGIASPALSRAVSGLEAQLGVRLFDRSTRHVDLTEAGRVLLAQARPALDSLDAAARRARRAAGPRRRLVLTLKADVEGGLLEPIAAAYRDEPEAVPLEVSFSDLTEGARLLRDGSADVALIFAPFDPEGLDYEVLAEEPLVVALAAGHPLAAQESISPADLALDHTAKSTGMLWWPSAAPEPPAFDGLSAMVQLIELGELVAFLPTSVAARYPRPGLATRPLAEVPPARLVVAWPRTATSPGTAAFVRAATDVAAAATRASARGSQDSNLESPVLETGASKISAAR